MAILQLTDEYNALGGVGGTCALCNASKRTGTRSERIITTDQVTDMQDAPPGVWPEKWMEFCEQCVNEMGHLVGMISEDEALALIAHRDSLAGERDYLRKQVEALEEALKAYRTIEEYQTPKVTKAAARS